MSLNKKYPDTSDDLQPTGSKYSTPPIGLIICCGIIVALFMSILII